MEKEIWKTVVIDGVEHPRYQVSNFGRVKCLDWCRTGKPRLCKLSDDGHGYLQVWIDGMTKKVHRIVAETFIPNPEGKPEVDHIDTNRHNNCVWNMLYCTHKENCNNPLSVKHYSENNPRNKTMLGKFGAEHNCSIPIVQLSLDGKFIKKWACTAEVERELGINHANINYCCRGKRKSAGGFKWMYYEDWIKKTKKPPVNI